MGRRGSKYRKKIRTLLALSLLKQRSAKMIFDLLRIARRTFIKNRLRSCGKTTGGDNTRSRVVDRYYVRTSRPIIVIIIVVVNNIRSKTYETVVSVNGGPRAMKIFA